MNAADLLGSGEVRHGAGDAEHAGVAAGGEAHRLRGLHEELAAGLVGRGERFERIAVELRVGALAT